MQVIKSFISIICFSLLYSVVFAQEQNKEVDLEALVSTYFEALDSVVDGKSNVYNLDSQKIAFIYLISSWSGIDPFNMDYTGYPKFNTENVKDWKSWYCINKEKIVREEFVKSIEYFSSDLIKEDWINYLDSIALKYRKY